MRIEKKEGRDFVYIGSNEREGQQEDSVNFTDNILIVLWKTYQLIHNPVENMISICSLPPFTSYFALSSAEVQEGL